MIILIFFAFLAGIVTILSPCILPILPIVLSGALSGGKMRPLGVITGFILSFTFFAVFAFTLARVLGITTEGLRYISVALLVVFGVSLFVPQVQLLLEKFASRFSPVGQKRKEGFIGGVVLGVSLGFVWTPCVGPILASVLTLAATSTITLELILITLAFSIGTSLPMLGIAYGGRHVIETLPYLRKRSEMIQKVFGVLIILTALMIFFNLDRAFQTYILEKFPQYGEGLTQFEDTEIIQDHIEELRDTKDRGGAGSLNIVKMLTEGRSQLAPNPTFDGGTKWLNSEPLSLDGALKGKVVLIDFWTYTCINCIRTFPHLKNWYETYKDDGFVIVGVHTPEFEFEQRTKNVQMALKKYGITYPVVQDNNYTIWNSYDNRYWPAHYLIDRKGHIRYTHFGEGNYRETENTIRSLLAEGGNVTGKVKDMPEQTPNGLSTPETYLGYARMERFGSPEEVAQDTPQSYTIASGMPEDYFAFAGTWTIGNERAVSGKDAQLALHFKAKGVHLVMRAVNGKGTVSVSVDGKPLSSEMSGIDVIDGDISIEEDRLYSILKFDKPEDHTVTFTFGDAPIEVYAFTFD